MDSINESDTPLNPQLDNNENNSENLGWHIISILSQILLLFTTWNSYNTDVLFWEKFELYYPYFPLYINMPLLKIFVLIITLLGFVVYFFFTTYKKNINLYNDMLSSWSKFHFIPLIFISALFIICSNKGSYYNIKNVLIVDIIFTIIALISLIIIYIKTTLNCDWYIVMAIKKGTYSTFIVLLQYNFLYTIICLIDNNYKIESYPKYSDYRDKFITLYKVTGILLPLIFGIGVFVFSLLFKDLMALFINLLIYTGEIIIFFNVSDSVKERRSKYLNGEAEGVIEIIFMGLTLGLIGFIAIRCKNKLF